MAVSLPWPGLVAGDRRGGLPAVTRAVGLLSGLIRQMPMDVWRGSEQLPRPALVDRPDPTPGSVRSWWVGQHVEDLLMHGNAVHVITSRDEITGLPTSALWVPAESVGITQSGWNPLDGGIQYWLNGYRLPTQDVVHVRRKADRLFPRRGVGVVEEHLGTFGKLHRQELFEQDAYSQSGVPSVAVVTPNSDMSQAEADAAKTSWMEKFARREPVILPSGTKVTPLAWSPTDSQMVEAHEMSLGDVALMFNLDGAWLGAPTKGMTYKSIGPLFLGLVRETIDPITDDLEQTWSDAWLMPGQKVKFDKNEILSEDIASEVAWISAAVEAKLLDLEEGRARLGYPPRPGAGEADGVAHGGDADRAKDAAEVSQKVYLAVANEVLDREEGRDLIRRAGANLAGGESDD